LVATQVSSPGQQHPAKQNVLSAGQVPVKASVFDAHPPSALIDRLSKAGGIPIARSKAVPKSIATRNRRKRDVKAAMMPAFCKTGENQQGSNTMAKAIFKETNINSMRGQRFI
jgi:hypothetical protein